MVPYLKPWRRNFVIRESSYIIYLSLGFKLPKNLVGKTASYYSLSRFCGCTALGWAVLYLGFSCLCLQVLAGAGVILRLNWTGHPGWLLHSLFLGLFLSLYVASHSPGPLLVAWTSYPTVVSEEKHFSHGNWLLRERKQELPGHCRVTAPTGPVLLLPFSICPTSHRARLDQMGYKDRPITF